MRREFSKVMLLDNDMKTGLLLKLLHIWLRPAYIGLTVSV